MRKPSWGIGATLLGGSIAIAALITDWQQALWIAVALWGGLALLCVPIFFLPREDEQPQGQDNGLPSYDAQIPSYDGKQGSPVNRVRERAERPASSVIATPATRTKEGEK